MFWSGLKGWGFKFEILLYLQWRISNLYIWSAYIFHFVALHKERAVVSSQAPFFSQLAAGIKYFARSQSSWHKKGNGGKSKKRRYVFFSSKESKEILIVNMKFADAIHSDNAATTVTTNAASKLIILGHNTSIWI